MVTVLVHIQDQEGSFLSHTYYSTISELPSACKVQPGRPTDLKSQQP
jgi:hypothetical protein